MRLQRIGRKNNPTYRVLVVDSRQGPKSGKYVDVIGSHDPKVDNTVLDGEKARTWIAKGVQVSPTVHNLLVTHKVIEGKKINVLPRKTPIVSEKPAEEAPAPEAAPTEVADAPAAEEAPAEATA